MRPLRGRRPMRDLPVFWKLLVPFVTLAVLLGASGAFLVVRDLTRRAQAQLDRELASRVIEARSVVRGRELYLLESVSFAANINGMAEAARRRDVPTVSRLTASVSALKRDLDVVAVTDVAGRLVGERRSARLAAAPDWASVAPVIAALADRTAGRHGAVLNTPSGVLLVIAAPICPVGPDCAATGAAVAAMRLDRIVAEIRDLETAGAAADVAVLALDGALLAGSGASPPAPLEAPDGQRLIRRRAGGSADRRDVAYARLDLQGRPAAVLAVGLPTAPAFATARGTAWRLALLLLLALAGVVGVGAAVSRLMLAQVRPLVDTSRRLGQGELTARAPVLGADELGELARRVNEMAEQLSASYETLESRVDQRTAEVQRLLRERTDFFASLSHELRTPVAIILGQCALLLNRAYTQDPAASDAASIAIRDSAQQLLDLVNEVLDVAKAEAGRIDVDVAPVSLHELAEELAPTLGGLARSAELTLSVAVPAHLPAVLADRRRVREVLLNLVDNAVKYTPPGGRVDVLARLGEGHVELSVADTGVGIPPDVGARVFEPFFRVEGTRTQRGEASSGLGLALSKRLVEAQGGRLTFTSESGTGTTFEFTLPVAPAVEPTKPRRRTPARPRKRAAATATTH